ncbi:MAG TPA: glycosyltransferase family 2 protein, partial [Chloroflexota bacterium]
MTAPVSVLVPTLDEELNLPECLDSLEWADEVYVVDSYSRDRTLEIAREHGANVVQHAFESYSRQKNWALDTLPFRNEWVLIVDADERVTPELRCEIEQVLASSTFDGYYLN